MLIGEGLPDDGEIRVPRDYRMAQLRQEWQPCEGDTVLDAALREFAPWHAARTAAVSYTQLTLPPGELV